MTPSKGKGPANGSKTGTPHAGTLRWQFPLRRTHAGVLMGNGTQGLMVWGGGRLELTLPEGWQLQRADLHLGTAALRILATHSGGQEATLTVNQAVTEELAWVDLPAPLAGKVGVKLIPSWEFVKEALQKVGVAAPAAWTETAEAGASSTTA